MIPAGQGSSTSPSPSPSPSRLPGGAPRPLPGASRPPNTNPNLWRDLVAENPMVEAAAREQRKFFKSAAGTGRLGKIVYGLAAIFYVWLIIESLAAHTDLTVIYSYLELVALTLCLPASVYAAISGEREKATWEALILTRLTPAQIVAGKLIWRLRMIGLVIAFLLPPMLVSRLLALQVDSPLTAVLTSQLMMICWGCLLCAFGLWVSALTQRSITTLAIIACSLIGALIAVPVLYGLFAQMLGSYDPTKDRLFILMMELNPFPLLQGIFASSSADSDSAYDNVKVLGHGGWPQCAIYLGVTAILIFLTLRRLRRLETPSRRGR